MKDLQVKTKHHYVWSYYLKGWSLDRKNIWYLSKKGKASFDSVRGLGRENHFYKVGFITDNDLKLMYLWLKDCSSELRVFHEQMIQAVQRIQRESKALKGRVGLDLDELIASNLFENYMSMQENNMVDVIQKLREGDLSCINDKIRRWEFSHYLGCQFSRTKRMRDSILYSTMKGPFDECIKNIWHDFYTRHWWFISSFIGTNLSKDIALNKKSKIKLLNNKSKTPFITSDQPVINLNPEGTTGTEIDYYYPVSNIKALVILNSGLIDFNEEDVSDNDVDFLNDKIASYAGDTIFSIDNDSIQRYKQSFDCREYKF